MGRERSNAWTSRSSFKAVVKDTLLFGSKNWLMNPRVGWNLEGFRKRVDQFLAGMRPQRDIMGRELYLPVEVVMSETGLEEVEKYVLLYQNTIDNYIKI